MAVEGQDHAEEPQEPDPNRNPDGTWKGGNRANPGGRPVGSISITALLKKRLRDHPEEADAIAQAIIDGVRDKDAAMVRLFLDRHDGVLKDQHEVTIVPHEIVLKDRKRPEPGEDERAGAEPDA